MSNVNRPDRERNQQTNSRESKRGRDDTAFQGSSKQARFSKAFETDVLTLITHDNSEHARSVVAKIDASMFGIPKDMTYEIASRVLSYWEDWKQPPGEAHIDTILGDILETNKEQFFRMFMGEMHILYCQPSFRPEFIAKRVDGWIARRRTKEGILGAAYAFNNEEVDTAEIIRCLPRVDDLPHLAKGHKTKLKMWSAADVASRPLTWIFDDYIPQGKLTLLAGMPKVGKSLLSLEIAACISSGFKLPNGQRPKQGNIVIFSAEDPLDEDDGEEASDDTIIPRLEAARADLRCIKIGDPIVEDISTRQKRMLDINRDIEVIKDKIEGIGNVRLVIFDTITSFLGNINTNLESQVRAALTPLVKLAANLGVAVLCILHFRKDASGSAMDRIIGTRAYTGIARSILAAVADPLDEERYLFYRVEGNFAEKRSARGYAYKIRSCAIEGIGRMPYIDWDGEATLKIGDALDGEENAGKLAEAEEFLCELIADGPVPSKEVEKAADAASISMATLRRARQRLKIVCRRRGKGRDAPYEYAFGDRR